VNEYERRFGLGELTGINLAGETPGQLPTDDSIESGRMYSHGDGVSLTAIQLASFVSTIANGGSLFQPQVVAPGHRFTPILRRQIKIDPKNRAAILEGMAGAVDYGTAKRAYDAEERIAGKTGTCIGNGSWLGLFASFSGVDKPNLVVVVITRGSSSRGKYAADIAGQVYKGLSSRYGTTASRPRRSSDSADERGTPTLANR
jgi:cell division protein FtsI/penicillin-binding protein 2